MDKILGVFGVGLGEFKLVLDRHDYVLGESVAGRVIFALTNPTEGRRLSVGLRATQTITSKSHQSDKGRSSSERRTEVLHDFVFDLDGEREYSQGEYVFELYIPPEAVIPTAQDDERLTRALGPFQRGPIEWEVWSKLTIPWIHGPGQRMKIAVRVEQSPEPPAFRPVRPLSADGDGKAVAEAVRPTVRSIEAAVRSRRCPQCGDHDHRLDAVFCCMCGTLL